MLLCKKYLERGTFSRSTAGEGVLASPGDPRSSQPRHKTMEANLPADLRGG